MRRTILAAAAALPLAACGGGTGSNPLHSANSGVSAFNSLLNTLNTTAGTLGRTQHGYGYGYPWGQRYQQPYGYAYPSPYATRGWGY